MLKPASRLAAGLLCSAAASLAVANPWRALGPDGGDVYALVADPNVAGRAYAATSGGLFDTDDAGRHWRATGASLVTLENIPKPRALLADPDQPGRLYYMTYDGRLFRSDDSGENWSATGYATPRLALPEQPYLHLVDVPGSTGTLLLALPDRYLYKSTDSGATFARFGYLENVLSLAVDPANPATVLANTAEWDGFYNAGRVRRSGDGGATWNLLLGGNAYHALHSLQFIGGGRIAAVYNSAVSISDDGGLTWSPRTSSGYSRSLAATSAAPPLLLSTNEYDCQFSANEFLDSQPCVDGSGNTKPYGRELIAVRDGATQHRFLVNGIASGVRAMAAGASSWESANAGLTGIDTSGLAILPLGGGVLLAGRVDLFHNGPRVIRSVDAGQNWTASLADRASNISDIQYDPNTLSLPFGPYVYAVGLRRDNSGGSNSGIYKSTNGGTSWTSMTAGLPLEADGDIALRSVRRIALDPRSCASPPASGPCTQGSLRTLYALASSAAGGAWVVLRSTDTGVTWTGVGTTLPRYASSSNGDEFIYTSDIAFDANGSTLYVSTYNSWDTYGTTPYVPTLLNGVFRSDNRGVNWIHRSNGLPLTAGSATTQLNVYALATHPRHSGVVWAAAGDFDQPSRVYKSTDGAASWTPIGTPLDGCRVTDLRLDPVNADVLYAAGFAIGPRPGCVYRSTDGGASWRAIDTGIAVRKVRRLRLHPQDRERIVLATERGIRETRVPLDRIFCDCDR